VVIIDEVNDYYDTSLKNENLEYLRATHGKDSFTFVKGDICDEALLEKIFSEHKIDYVCHLAARAGVRPSIEDPQVYVHSNIRGTTALLSAAAKHKVKNFVYASSSSVYGGSKSTYFSEDEAVDMPVSPYAATKKACELLAHTYSHLYNLPCTGLRFFTVFGERGRPDMAPFKFVDRISRGEGMQQFGDGSSSRDYTYISDIVDGVVRSIDRPYKYQVFNLGKGSGTTLKDFISIVEKYTGKKANKTILPDQPGDVPRTCASTEKATALLGYKAVVPFDEGIRQLVLWYNKKNGIANCHAVESVGHAFRSMRKRGRADGEGGKEVKEVKKARMPASVSMDQIRIPGNLASTF
jgi:UDP-glucuronate 4-epimerase